MEETGDGLATIRPATGMTTPTTRPDLTDYRVYIDVLLERLNQDSVYRMSIEDLMKLLIEKAMREYCPDVVVVPIRKRYITITLEM